VKRKGCGQVDPELDPDIAAAIIVNIVIGQNQLALVKNPNFELNASAHMLKLLTERFLLPQAIRAVKQVRHPKRGENGRKIPP
jgi:hypothetical protein